VLLAFHVTRNIMKLSLLPVFLNFVLLAKAENVISYTIKVKISFFK